MAQQIVKYKVLVASPSDVKDEREAVDEVVQELNLTYGSRNNLVIETVKWETHTAPAIGLTNSTQDIIDSDLGNDYDLFVGILWKKFGTPTGSFGSGTEQEFRRAYEKFHKRPNSIQILFYFKMAAPLSISSNDLDPVELIKIGKFKEEIGEKSVYYFEYNAIEDLQKFLRIHIPQRIDSLKSHSSTMERVDITRQGVAVSEDDDLGVMDYNDIVEETAEYANQALLQIAGATTWIGEEIIKKTAELDKLKLKGSQIANKTLRDFFQRTASVMNVFITRVEPEIAVFKNNFDITTKAISRLTLIYQNDPTGVWDVQADEALRSVSSLINATDNAIQGIKGFLDTMVFFPRIERELNKARRGVEEILGELMHTLEVSRVVCVELEKNLEL